MNAKKQAKSAIRKKIAESQKCFNEIEAIWKSPDHCPAGIIEIHENSCIQWNHFRQVLYDMI